MIGCEDRVLSLVSVSVIPRGGKKSMSIIDYFKPIPTMNAAQVRELLSRKDPSEYNLIDVRQPREYERAHLPGARLMPVAELLSLAGTLDPNKPTLAY